MDVRQWAEIALQEKAEQVRPCVLERTERIIVKASQCGWTMIQSARIFGYVYRLKMRRGIRKRTPSTRRRRSSRRI